MNSSQDSQRASKVSRFYITNSVRKPSNESLRALTSGSLCQGYRHREESMHFIYNSTTPQHTHNGGLPKLPGGIKNEPLQKADEYVQISSQNLLLLLLLSCFSHVRLCATPQKAVHQAPLSLGCSRQEPTGVGQNLLGWDKNHKNFNVYHHPQESKQKAVDSLTDFAGLEKYTFMRKISNQKKEEKRSVEQEYQQKTDSTSETLTGLSEGLSVPSSHQRLEEVNASSSMNTAIHILKYHIKSWKYVQKWIKKFQKRKVQGQIVSPVSSMKHLKKLTLSLFKLINNCRGVRSF